ncbi:DUF1232 domain-containing protein [Halobacillus salinarum]|uniref:DUF1232 domain-containing protein n=1 Tax=Halobacillus salinarum TaxID=2932257 RepID=A0ABY4ELD3_9BACI|nr:DUF1232 domain-containing protein [Halobacillus salinarum]UOQ44387.1 DUF1232 domain-containing protein [Halobacillus salinarum]
MIRLWKRIKFVFQIKKSIPFFIQFFRSEKVSRQKKWFSILLMGGYLLFPWDVIPDFLFALGLIDDLTVFTFVLQLLVKLAPESLKEEYRLDE